ncbi:hypothetical protein FE257_004118 [Aspergillus nanangensis]|uniref:Dynamin-binding protein n=1 Tax=Aspergillus nanangensis TaxID=2582783 RepID=A0AAD4CAW7_ASPNN|nr:hypothetical protein FE257_004118 [Aspergillus nanangensis]
MSGSDVEPSSCFLNGDSHQFRRQTSPTPDDSFFEHPSSLEASSPFPLTGTTYSADLGPTTSSSNYPSHIDTRISTDPDRYYRSHTPALTAEDNTGVLVAEASLDSIIAENYPPSFQRVSSVPTPLEDPSSSAGRLGQYRSASDTYRGTGAESTRGSSARVPVARARQASFKDLINKFNNNADQVLPLPSKSISRGPSRAASPTSPLERHTRSRPSSRPTGNNSVRRQTSASRWNSGTGLSDNVLADSTPLSTPHDLNINSSLSQPNFPESLRHRPRFGDLLSVDTSFLNAGHGTPSHRRRRGSEGSIASPNPGVLEHFDPPSGLSPLTPTAWYLGQTPFLEAVSTGANPHNHRRTRSDISGNWPGGAAVHAPDSHMAVQAPLHPISPSSLESSPHSKSRIPISSRHLHSGSVSDGSASPTARSESAFSNRVAAQVPLPPKGSSRLPKPAPRSPPLGSKHEDKPTFSLSPRARREAANGRSRHQLPSKGSPLEAYIAAPPPKKSPQLRSSRPRQPVGNTASPASRTKVVETVSNFQRQFNHDRELRSSRPRDRRPPELGFVDFATRRQRIQQAFNRTVQENERKEEKAAELRRQVKAREDRQEEAQTPAPEHPQTNISEREIPPQPEDTATVIEDSVEVGHEENQLTPITGDPRKLPQLHVDTDVCSQGSEETTPESHPITMDSPTLGRSDVGMDSKSSSVPPVSAISNDTHVTAFDPEPQEGLSRQSIHASNRTLLNQIMQFRESSSGSSSCDERDYGFSDIDDKETIPVLSKGAMGENRSIDHTNREPYLHQKSSGTGLDNKRWSMASWSSSLRNQHSTDDQCEESGDDLSQIQPSADESEVATTQSCSASSCTPESVTATQLQPQDDSAEHMIAGESAANKVAYRHSSTPSLVRLGGWDSKRVSQLYLEELTRGRGHQLPMPAIRASPEPRTSAADRRADGNTNSLTDDPVLVSKQDIPPSERLGHTASLVFKDDWEHASPSILDWMQVAAEESRPSSQITVPNTNHDGTPTPRLRLDPNDLSSEQNGGDNLGLAINVPLPHEVEVDEARSPPLAQHEPPTLPTETPAEESLNTLPTSQHMQISTNTFQNVSFAPLGLVHSTGSSGDSSLQHIDPVPSPHGLDSSSTSLAPSTSEQVRPKATSPSPEQRRLKKRRHVIKELVDTEYTFGRDMKVVDDIYKGTSSSCLDLSTDDVKVLFANSDQIVQFSTMFLDALKEAARSVYVMPKSQRWSSKRSTRNYHAPRTDTEVIGGGPGPSDLDKDLTTCIGQAFVTHMTHMEKVYADYLKNHDAANKKLQTLQQNPKVAIWLKECRDWASDLTTAWDLDSLLVKPVQRILKYPLLLTQLLDSTTKDHPDRAALLSALEEVTNISVRINEMKKRADVVGQVVGRKRKESDVTAAFSKAFGRRTEKLKQQVGLADIVEDKEYDSLSHRFGDNFLQLQVVMRDADTYIHEVQGSMVQFSEFVTATEGLLDVSQTNYSELENKWRELRVTVQGLMSVALPDHISTVRKSVIDPMVTLLKLHDGPQRVMKKRDKRLMDYARFKSIKDRGDKPDKKTTSQGEQFVALNETLKDELPKLYALTGKLMAACLENFVHIQTIWFKTLQEKLTPLVDAFPDDIQKIVSDWTATSNFSEAQVLTLGICNGSLLADAVNLVNFNTPSTGATVSSPRRPSTVNSASTRVGSGLEESPKVSHDFSSASGRPFQSPSIDGQSQASLGRHRADSTFSGRAAPDSVEIPRSQILQQITHTSSSSIPTTNSNPESFPSLPQLSLDSPFLTDVISPSNNEAKANEEQPTSPGGRYSGFFSSAMPMSDGPQDNTKPENQALKEPSVLFLAASIYEFNIDRARREAGYPYLTYVAGEIFDVIAEKGELWLAKNQDDSTHQVGWIWNKHFAKLSS